MAVSVSKAGPYYSSGAISFSSLRSNFKDTSSGSVSASELLRVTDTTNTDPIVPDATENADIGYLKNPNITGTTVTVSGQSYSVGGTSYPVQGKLWVPTSLPDNSIDLVVAYHGTIDLDPSPGATTILDASNTNLTLLKGNNIGIDDKIIFSVAYPQDGITATQNLNLLNPAQLSTFEFGDNLPYARAALLWAKNNLNSYIAGLGGTKTINNVYMFGHSQGGSLVHKLNTLETTNGAIANAPGPIRLDITCENQENLGLVGPDKTLNPTNVTCQKLFNAYGSAATASEYQDVSLLYNYVTGHKAKITYLQALDDPTGGTSGVGQVYWMNELTAAMSANGQSYEYITVPTGGHDAFYKPQNTTLHRAIRGVVGGYGTNLSTSQFRNSIKFYYVTLPSSDEVTNFDIDAQTWNSNLNKNIRKWIYINGTCGSNDASSPAASFDATAYKLTIDVSGRMLGAGGRGGGTSGAPEISGESGGNALSVTSSGGNNVIVNVKSGAQIYGGGGGGEKGGTGSNGSAATCKRSQRYTQQCQQGAFISCPGGWNQTGSGQDCCEWNRGCSANNWWKQCEQTIYTSIPQGGAGGNGGTGRGYNNQSGSLDGAEGGSASCPSCPGGYSQSGGSCSSKGENGGDGGNWGSDGGDTNNTENGGNSGRAIAGSNYSVAGTIISTVKGAYIPS